MCKVSASTVDAETLLAEVVGCGLELTEVDSPDDDAVSVSELCVGSAESDETPEDSVEATAREKKILI